MESSGATFDVNVIHSYGIERESRNQTNTVLVDHSRMLLCGGWCLSPEDEGGPMTGTAIVSFGYAIIAYQRRPDIAPKENKFPANREIKSSELHFTFRLPYCHYSLGMVELIDIAGQQ